MRDMSSSVSFCWMQHYIKVTEVYECLYLTVIRSVGIPRLPLRDEERRKIGRFRNFFSNRSQVHLALVKTAVKAAVLHQFRVSAGFNNFTGIQDQNFVRIANCAQAMSDDERGSPF